MHSDEKFIEALAAIVGSDAVLSGEEAAPHFKDWRGRYAVAGIAVVFPSSTPQVSEVVKLCAVHKVAIVPQG
ncbi:MAG: hydroxyacid dehydrogenase, partial [Pseudomonadota bacterium]